MPDLLWALSARRAWIISLLGIWLFISTLHILADGLYYFTVLMLTEAGILAFAFLTRLPSGAKLRRLLFELACFIGAALLFIFGSWWGRVIHAEDFSQLQNIYPFFILLGAFSHIAVRGFARPYAVWKAMRRRRLMWEITHAQLRLVLLTMIVVFLVLARWVIWPTSYYAEHSTADILNNNIALMISVAGLFGIVTGLLLVIVVIPSGLISYITARQITQRIEQLAGVTRAVRDGDESLRVQVSGRDEIARLQSDFNLMMEQMETARRALEQERDTVQKLLQVRQRLFADVSHELRTPIAIIRGYLDGIPPHEYEDVALIQREVLRLQGLVDDVFTLARADVQQLPYHIKPLEVGGLLEQTTQSIQKQAWQARKVEVILDYQPQLPLVMADQERLEQVLYNLLRNAIRHTPPGGLIRVGARATDEAVWVEVQDTGAGISPEDLALVWERFHRSADSDGAGLGLALVKEMVEAMGGAVGVMSEVDKGSCFRFSLPRVGRPQPATLENPPPI